MGLVPEDRAIARSDEPEARSDARWRERAGGDTLDGIAERWPALASCPPAVRWLVLQQDLGRSPRTVEAYARSLVDYLRFCERVGVDVVGAGRAEIAGYVRDLRERPGRHGANVVALDSGAGLSNATLQLRVTVVRLFYDFLVEEGVRDRNPVGRGYRVSGRARAAGVGWSPRFESVAVDPDRRAVARGARGRRRASRCGTG